MIIFHRYKVIDRINLILSVAFTGCMTGCGMTIEQQAAVEKFSAATVRVAGLTAEEVARVRRDVIELRQGMLELRSSNVDLEDRALDLDGPLDLEDAAARLQATAALKRFGELLQALIGEGDGSRVRRSGDRFVAGLQRIERLGLSDSQAKSLGQLFVWAGESWIGSRKRRVIREVVMETRQPLQAVTGHLRETFDPEAGLWATGFTQTVFEIENTLDKQLRLSDAPEDASDERSIRRARYRQLRADAARRRNASEQARNQVLAALDKFERAHDALFHAIQGEDVSAPQIDLFFQEVDRLTRSYRLIRE